MILNPTQNPACQDDTHASLLSQSTEKGQKMGGQKEYFDVYSRALPEFDGIILGQNEESSSLTAKDLPLRNKMFSQPRAALHYCSREEVVLRPAAFGEEGIESRKILIQYLATEFCRTTIA